VYKPIYNYRAPPCEIQVKTPHGKTAAMFSAPGDRPLVRDSIGELLREDRDGVPEIPATRRKIPKSDGVDHECRVLYG